MKNHKKYFLIIYTLLSTLLFAQNISFNFKNQKKPQKIDARQFLKKHDKIVEDFHKNNPNFEQESRLKKSNWNFSVGTKKDWFAFNIEDDNFYTVPSTCRAIGTNCYIFVENAIWNSKVTQENVNAIKNGFDNSTPANSNKGIYATVVQNFGSPPNIDGDPKIIILILDIKDGYNKSGKYIAGYFHSVNQISHTYSNMAEIYYLDADPSNLSTEDGLNKVLSTTAHEFQHMIDYNYHKTSQLIFLNEGCSLVSEVICGYPLYNQTYFNNDYNHYLLDWREGEDVLSDYSRAAKYMTYMYGQFGKSFLNNFVKSNQVGISGINDALSKTQPSTSLRFTESLTNWFKANTINNTNYPEWSYTIPNVYNVSPTDHKNPNYISSNITVAQAAADYILFSEGRKLEINFNDYGDGVLEFIAVKILNNNIISVEDITPNTNLIFNDFGTNYDKIIFSILNPDADNTHIYKYSSKGSSNSIELSYDENPPTGYLDLSVNDTICVFFDSVPNGFLDSIKVGLANVGPINGAIYKFTGNSRPTPLGKKLADITATSKFKQGNISSWSNWAKINLTSQNISTDNEFAVAFVIKGQYPQQNQVMVTSQSQENIHSYTYLNNPGSGVAPNWFYISSSDTEAYAYLIRAYVSFDTTKIKDKEIVLLPSQSKLVQNYPNPFNAITTINYSIPKNEKHKELNVGLFVFDILGKKVKTLVNAIKQPGNYSVNFNASKFSSGTYFYVLKVGGNIQAKKMILLK